MHSLLGSPLLGLPCLSAISLQLGDGATGDCIIPQPLCKKASFLSSSSSFHLLYSMLLVTSLSSSSGDLNKDLLAALFLLQLVIAFGAWAGMLLASCALAVLVALGNALATQVMADRHVHTHTHPGGSANKNYAGSAWVHEVHRQLVAPLKAVR